MLAYYEKPNRAVLLISEPKRKTFLLDVYTLILWVAKQPCPWVNSRPDEKYKITKEPWISR